jgi:Mg2+ and Co2+ transporter CorA
MKQLTGLVINIDPVAIIEDQINFLENNRLKMNGEMGKLKGQQKNLETVITDNTKAIEKHLLTAQQAQKRNIGAQVSLETRAASRLKESNDRLNQLLSKIVMIYKILQKMYENSGYLLEDTKMDVNTRKREYAAMKTAYSAVSSAMKVINGDPDRMQLFEQAMDVIAQDISMKVGEMERFMEVSA